MINFLEKHASAIRQVCREHRVRRLDVFGSITSETFHEKSDIDFLVEFDREDYTGAFEQFMGFKMDLEALLGRKVDLVISRSFKNHHFRKEVEETKQFVYAA